MATNFIQQAKKLKEHTQLKEVGIRKCLSKTDRDTLRESVKEMKKFNSERTIEEQDLFFWSIRNLKATKHGNTTPGQKRTNSQQTHVNNVHQCRRTMLKIART